MRYRNFIVSSGILAFLLVCPSMAGESSKQQKEDHIKKAVGYLTGCTKYSEKSPYSSIITYMALGYGEDGKPAKAAVIHSFKTYSKVTGILIVRKDGEKFVVDKAEIVDIDNIKDADKRRKADDAIKHIQGQVIKDGKKKQKKLDVITGATKYSNSIFTAFDLMAKEAVKEMESNPSWKRKDMPTAGDAGNSEKGKK